MRRRLITAKFDGSGASSGSKADGGAGGAAASLANIWPVIICAALALAVWLVFGQTTGHDFINFDDNAYVYDNRAISQGISPASIVWAFTHSHGANWHPLTTLSHMLDCQLYGLNPGRHHLTNVLLHAATAMLLFLVLSNLTGALWRSAFVAAVFAIHPLRVESVAWISERKDVLSGLFFMLTVGAYARYVEQCKIKNAKCKMSYALALLCFALGLMSKPMLVTLPFILLLLDYWPLKRFPACAALRRGGQLPGASKRSEDGSAFNFQFFKEKIPFFLLAAGSCAATLLAQRSTIQAVQGLSLGARVGNVFVAYLV